MRRERAGERRGIFRTPFPERKHLRFPRPERAVSGRSGRIVKRKGNEVTLMTLGRTRKAHARKQSRKTHRIIVRDASIQFFYDHAGYSYGKGETPEQGRMRGAK